MWSQMPIRESAYIHAGQPFETFDPLLLAQTGPIAYPVRTEQERSFVKIDLIEGRLRPSADDSRVLFSCHTRTASR